MRSWKGPTEARRPSRLIAPIEVGRVEQRLAVDHREAADRRHELRAVEQREAFLGLEREGREPRGPQSGPGRLAPAASVEQLALAHHRQHQVRRGREIAGGAQRAAGRHPGRRGRRRSSPPAARRPRRARPSSRCASVFRRIVMAARTTSRGSGAPTPTAWLRTRFSCSSRTLLDGDVRRRELAEAGGDAVGDLLLGDDVGDHLVRAIDALDARRSPRDDAGAAARHRHDGVDRQRPIADHHTIHVPSSVTAAAPPHRATIPPPRRSGDQSRGARRPPVARSPSRHQVRQLLY